MGIFNDNDEEEGKEITSDILDLYNEIINGNFEELKSGSTAYEREYKKIIQSLKNYFNNDILGSGVPDFLYQLERELHNEGWPLKDSTTIKTIEMGLKKIMKKMGIDIPKEKELNQKHQVQSPQQIIVNASPTMNTEVNISNDTKIKVENLIEDFRKELDSNNPKKRKLWDTFRDILKLLGFIIG